MKKIMTGSILAMAAGAGMMAYALSCKDTKKQATKLVNNAMDTVNNKLNQMKQRKTSIFFDLKKLKSVKKTPKCGFYI